MDSDTELRRYGLLISQFHRLMMEAFKEKVGEKGGWNQKRWMNFILSDLEGDVAALRKSATDRRTDKMKRCVDIGNRAAMLWNLIAKGKK